MPCFWVHEVLAGVASAGLIAGMSSVPAVAGVLPFERLAGPSGVETSLAVAKHTWGDSWKVVYVASNRNPVDALPAATIGDGPVVLTDGNSLNLGGVKPGKIVRDCWGLALIIRDTSFKL
nr:cell wall-binding repeat-containing protein [Mobiluncus mulieris]